MEVPGSPGSTVEEILFLGTGTSSCTPLLGCLLRAEPSCAVCLSAAAPGPSKNRRLNPCALVRYRPADGGALRNVLLDCGKTFYAAALAHLVPARAGPLEAVLLTHGHVDAMLGLDDLRHFTAHGAIQDAVEVWADAATMAVVERTFPYLVDPAQATGGGFVAALRFRVMGAGQPFRVGGLSVRPFVVEHGVNPDGSPYPALGFLLDGDRLAYISDVSRVPPETIGLLRDKDLLVLDCLRDRRSYASHLILPQAVELVRALRPRRTLFVGLAHDVDHDEFEARIRAAHPDLDIRLAYDGLVVRFV